MTRMFGMAPGIALGLGIALGPASAHAAAQSPDELGALMDTLAALWSSSDASAVAAHGARTGLDLEVYGEPMGPLHGRRAAAALRQLMGGQETVTVETGSSSRIVGAEDRAFGEFVWVVRVSGTEATENNLIFMALVREDDRWRVSQIRILR